MEWLDCYRVWWTALKWNGTGIPRPGAMSIPVDSNPVQSLAVQFIPLHFVVVQSLPVHSIHSFIHLRRCVERALEHKGRGMSRDRVKQGTSHTPR